MKILFFFYLILNLAHAISPVLPVYSEDPNILPVWANSIPLKKIDISKIDLVKFQLHPKVYKVPISRLNGYFKKDEKISWFNFNQDITSTYIFSDYVTVLEVNENENEISKFWVPLGPIHEKELKEMKDGRVGITGFAYRGQEKDITKVIIQKLKAMPVSRKESLELQKIFSTSTSFHSFLNIGLTKIYLNSSEDQNAFELYLRSSNGNYTSPHGVTYMFNKTNNELSIYNFFKFGKVISLTEDRAEDRSCKYIASFEEDDFNLYFLGCF